MKKLVLGFVLTLFCASTVWGQVDTKAIGLRMGSGFGYGAEVSYQHPLSKNHRVEIDFGLNRSGFGLNGIYHWVWDLSDLADGFNWYAGFGGGVGLYNFDYVLSPLNSPSLSLGVVGQVGIEYKFEIPITLSLDYRPGIYFINGINPSVDGICIAGRYRF